MQETEVCPHCKGVGVYKKGWDMPQRRQVKGKPKGTYIKTGKVTRVRLYKCKNCQRNFRKGETLINGNPADS
jgi:hypothetical protein